MDFKMTRYATVVYASLPAPFKALVPSSDPFPNLPIFHVFPTPSLVRQSHSKNKGISAWNVKF
jgi:hypothetical protein